MSDPTPDHRGLNRIPWRRLLPMGQAEIIARASAEQQEIAATLCEQAEVSGDMGPVLSYLEGLAMGANP